MDSSQEKAWRNVKYGQRFLNAFRGIYVMIRSTRHIFIHILAAATALFFGWYFRIDSLEWVAIVFAIGFVFAAEAFNTAIEIDIDLTSPEYHPYARDTKDAAAGAVLLASISAVAIGLIIFVPRFL